MGRGSQAGGGLQAGGGGSQAGGGGGLFPGGVEFLPANNAIPTIGELLMYQTAVGIRVDQIIFLLNFIRDDPTRRPPRPGALATSSTPVAIW